VGDVQRRPQRPNISTNNNAHTAIPNHTTATRHASSTIHSRSERRMDKTSHKPTHGGKTPTPTANNITIMQIYNSQHYTTIITDNNKYYYYDGFGIPVPHTITHLYNHLRRWYGSSLKPPALRNESPTLYTPYTPRQRDGWSCAMHMLLTSLSAIYQGRVPILQYCQRHVV